MSKHKRVILTIYTVLCACVLGNKVLAADFCGDQYYINQTLANGAAWDMCWSHNKNQGIAYHHIFYTPKNGIRRMVLSEASIAQIHVPYDDDGARFHDVSDFGLGDDGGNNNNLVRISPNECVNGNLSYFNSKAAVCRQVVDGGSAYRNGSARTSSEQLKVFSISKVGQYVYSIEWNFQDDGRIKPVILATGSLQRFSAANNQVHGWPLGRGARVGLGHMHNFYWRLDFDIDSTSTNDTVNEINFDLRQGRRYKTLTRFSRESARSVNPSKMRSWIVRDGNTTNSKGHNIAYEIRLDEAGQREVGPSYEPFTKHDFYVTQSRKCELYASHNQRVNSCAADNLADFVNGESIVNKDIVTWVAVSFYHLPRSEDAPKMDAHVSGFQLIPRDWHTTNPSLALAPQVSLRLSANDDFVTTESAPILIDVMANDTGRAIAINTLDNPSNGTSRVVNNKVQYIPNQGFIGRDVFWYTIKDSAGSIYGTKIHVDVVRPRIVTNNGGNGVSTGGGGATTMLEFLALLLLSIGFWVFATVRPAK